MTEPDAPSTPTQPSAGTAAPPSVGPTSNAQLLGPVGAIIAGLLGLIGGSLPWVSIDFVGAGSQSIQTLTLFSAGSLGPWRTAVFVLSAIIVILAARYLFGSRNRRLLSIAAVFCLLLLGVGAYKIVNLYRRPT